MLSGSIFKTKSSFLIDFLGAFSSRNIEILSLSVMFDTNSDDLPVDSIRTDGFFASRMVVEHLVRWGHRRIVTTAYQMDD